MIFRSTKSLRWPNVEFHREHAIGFALLERDDHARAGAVAEDHLDRRALAHEHRGHHSGRGVGGESAETEHALGCHQLLKRLYPGRGPNVDDGIHRAGTADIVELRGIEAHADPIRHAFDEPGATWHSDRETVGSRTRRHVIRRDNSRGAFEILHDRTWRARNEPHQVARHDARRRVHATARRETDDCRQRLAAIEFVCPRSRCGP